MVDRIETAIERMAARVNEHRSRMLLAPEPEQRAVAEALFRESRAALAALLLFAQEK